MKLDRPAGEPDQRIGWGSDIAAEMLRRYASKTHSVGARLEADDSLTIVAPFGLDDIFSFRIVPNRALMNKPAHDAKGARAKGVWPELTVLPWDAAEA